MQLPTTIDRSIFRAYDIRGLAATQLTPEVAYAIGRGFGSTLIELYKKDAPTVAVGRDARTHGPALEEALVQGLVECGCEVLLIGQTPSPMNYFAICHEQLDGGVQITASHNPAEYNGCKLQTREAHAYAGEQLQELYERIAKQQFTNGSGTTAPLDIQTPYTKKMVELFPNQGKGLHVVVDAGNGVAGPDYCAILRAVGCQVTELYTEPDGTFPNHAADPSKLSTLKELQETVAAIHADMGFAYDGDGDRVGLVDETGAIRSADEILLLLAEDHLARFPNGNVVCTVSNSGTIPSEVTAWGGTPIMCQVGHSHVEHAMVEHGALLGGEQSGHFFCAEGYYSYDDALVASLHILHIVTTQGKSIGELCAEFPPVVQLPEHRPHCLDNKKTAIITSITEHFSEHYETNTLDGVRIDFGNDGWAGIRQSNTSPCISICIEARTEQHAQEIYDIVYTHLKTYPEIEL